MTIANKASGGLELLFSNQRKHYLSLPVVDEQGRTATMDSLVRYLCQYVMKDSKKDMFVVDGAVYVKLELQFWHCLTSCAG